jgi:hypothetical protein
LPKILLLLPFNIVLAGDSSIILLYPPNIVEQEPETVFEPFLGFTLSVPEPVWNTWNPPPAPEDGIVPNVVATSENPGIAKFPHTETLSEIIVSLALILDAVIFVKGWSILAASI